MADDEVHNEPMPIEDDDVEEDEYNVEAIRAERKNSRTGVLEYLIKWENYPDSANTWEPIDNLKCPDIIQKFKDKEKNKRKRRSATGLKEGVQSGPKRARQTEEPIILEDTEIGSTTETLSSTDTLASTSKTNAQDDGQQQQQQQQQQQIHEEVVDAKGFDRGLPIEDIIGSCTDDNERLFFFVKWKGVGELEMISSDELEEHEPRELCIWYRKRLLQTINNPDGGDVEKESYMTPRTTPNASSPVAAAATTNGQKESTSTLVRA